MTRHTYRAAIVAWLREHPGSTTEEVAEAVGCDRSCAYHHLRRTALKAGWKVGKSKVSALWELPAVAARMQPVGRLWPHLG